LDYAIRLVYPSDYGDKAVLKTLQSKLIAKTLGETYTSLTPGEAVSANIEDWKSEYEKAWKDKDENQWRPDPFVYEYERENKILFTNGDLLQMCTNSNNLNGSLSHWGGSSSYLFNLHTGDEYSRDDIFKPEAAAGLGRLVLSAIRDSINDTNDWRNNLTEEEVWNGDTPFAIRQEDIVVSYATLSAGSWLFDYEYVAIPYARLNPFLHEGTPVWTLANSDGASTASSTATSTANSAESANKSSAANDPETVKLWAMLSGYWGYMNTSGEPISIYDFDVTYFFGFSSDAHEPVSCRIWSADGAEAEYTRKVTAIGEQRYRVTVEIPAREGDMLFEAHDAITKTYEIDMSRYADRRITVSAEGEISEWEYAGKEMPFSISNTDIINTKGNVVQVHRYEDRTGSNLIILTETDIESRPDPADKDFTLRSKELYARRYVYDRDREELKSAWQVTDFVRDCPLYDISVSFIGDAFRITDLNGDGLSEIWMVYTLACRGDTSPKTMKIIMYEGDRKYALRGETRSLVADFGDPAKNEYAGGDYVPDAAFNAAPPAFLSFAKELWEKYKSILP